MALGDNRALISCGLVTNDGHFLTGLPLPTDHRSYIHCSFLTDTECPDPCLELFFQCRAYRDYQGYRNLHRTHARFTSTDVAELRIIRLEAPNNENMPVELRKLTFQPSARGQVQIYPLPCRRPRERF